MRPNISLLFVPRAIAPTLDALDRFAFLWAQSRKVPTFALRVSGPAVLPGTEYELWPIECAYAPRPALMLADWSRRTRAVVGLRIHGASSIGAALVFIDGEQTAQLIATSDTEMDEIAADALYAFVGPFDANQGWLDRILAAHEANAEVRVARWNDAAPASPAWPKDEPRATTWTLPLDDETERAIAAHAAPPTPRRSPR